MLGYSSGSTALKVGWGATCHKMSDVTYERIDIVNNKQINHGTLIGVNPRITHEGKPAVVANFTYSDIWYERQAISIGIPVSFANVQNLTLSNLRGESGNWSSISLIGASEQYSIDDIHFHNVTLDGRLLTEKALGEGMVAKFAEHLTFS